MGLSFEETSAIIGQMAEVTGTPAEAFDRFKALGSKMANDPRFKGKGMEGIDTLMRMPEAEVKAFLGDDAEKHEAYLAIRSQHADIAPAAARYRQVAKDTGTAQDAIQQQVALRMSDPTERALFELGQEEKRKEIVRERNLATDKAKGMAAFEGEQARLETAKAKPLEFATATGYAAAAEYAAAPPATVRRAGQAGQTVGRMLPPRRASRWIRSVPLSGVWHRSRSGRCLIARLLLHRTPGPMMRW